MVLSIDGQWFRVLWAMPILLRSEPSHYAKAFIQTKGKHVWSKTFVILLVYNNRTIKIAYSTMRKWVI